MSYVTDLIALANWASDWEESQIVDDAMAKLRLWVRELDVTAPPRVDVTEMQDSEPQYLPGDIKGEASHIVLNWTNTSHD